MGVKVPVDVTDLSTRQQKYPFGILLSTFFIFDKHSIQIMSSHRNNSKWKNANEYTKNN